MLALQGDTFATQCQGSFRRCVVSRGIHPRVPDVRLTHTCRDTVSSIGIFRGRSLPETTTGMNHVCFFRHALAPYDLHVKLLPEYANGGAGPDTSAKHIKEVWFAGSHSDMYPLTPLCNVRLFVLINSSAVAGTFPTQRVLSLGQPCAGCRARRSTAYSRCNHT